MAKILEKNVLVNGKIYKQNSINIPSEVLAAVSYKKGDRVQIKSDSQNRYIIVERIEKNN